MRVAVTGGDGYIGRVLRRRLALRGHDVIAFDSALFAGCSYADDEEADGPSRRLDMRDVAPRDLRGLDAVCHLAALSNDPLGELDEALTREINVGATLRAAVAARDAGVPRFVFASSCSIYGRQPDGVAADEDAALEPLTAYARSKVAAELALHGLASRDFSPVYLRQATAYGWSERFRFDLVVNNFVGAALASGAVRLLSDGSAWRPIAHVEDLAAAFVAAVEAPREAVHDTALNVGGDESNYRIRDLATTVATAIGVPVEVAPGAGTDHRSYRVSFARIRERLPGWAPVRRPAEGAREIRDALVRRGFRPADLEDERFTRIRRLRRLVQSRSLDGNLRPMREGTVAAP